MVSSDLEELKNLPALSWEQRSSAEHVVKVYEARAKYFESLKGVDTKILKEVRLSNTHWTDYFPHWATLWLFYIGAWGWLMMTFRKDVWPR